MKLKKFNHQPNIISERMDNLSLVENRVLYHVINQMSTTMEDVTNTGQNLTFIIPLSNLGESNYSRLKESIKKLQDRKFIIKDDSKKNQFLSITPFPKVEMTSHDIRITMLADVVPFFQKLKGGYTKYEVKTALGLASIYSQKMFELLSRHKHKGVWEIEPDQLKISLSATSYRYADFKKRCIVPALDEIEAKTELRIDLYEDKQLRSVINLKFVIKTELQQALEVVEEDLEMLDRMSPGETAGYMHNLFNDYQFNAKQIEKITSDTQIWKRFYELDAKIFRGILAPANKTAYMATCLFNSKKKTTKLREEK